MLRVLTLAVFAAIFSTTFAPVFGEDSVVLDHKVKTIDGEEKSLSDYKGKVLLVVNVASACGYTRQYTGLEELQTRFHDKGLEVLGFPCNQFGRQEPGSEAEIKEFCSIF